MKTDSATKMGAKQRVAMTSAINADEQLKQIESDADIVLAEIDGVAVIENQQQYAALADVLVDIVVRKNALKDLKTSITKPIRAAESATRDLFRPVEEKLNKIEEALRTAMAKWKDDTREAIADAKELLRTGSADDRVAAMEELQRLGVVEDEARAEPANAVASSVWVFEIEDPALVPREFMIVDETAILNAVRQGTRVLAGVRIYQKTQIAAKPRKASK